MGPPASSTRPRFAERRGSRVRGTERGVERRVFQDIESELQALSELRDKPAGTIRITATENAADTILLPKLAYFLPKYPDVKVEIVVDYGLADIVAQRFDAGVRSGEQGRKT